MVGRKDRIEKRDDIIGLRKRGVKVILKEEKKDK